MRPCIKSSEIPRELKADLPVIPNHICNERFCTICPYYAGVYQKKRRCMLVNCAWDDEREIFHPALKKMLTLAAEELSVLENAYREKKHQVELLQKMFTDELAEDQKKTDKCYGCPYGVAKPCIGICYAELAGRRKK